jgi:3' terminal RNA ribose 2'-O-methyltransferase Hen1
MFGRDDPSIESVPRNLFRLNSIRLQSVIDALKARNVKSVIDMGCGEGKLLQLLLKDKSFTKIAGTDVSLIALERAEEKLKLETLSEEKKNRITLFQSSVTYNDYRFSGYDSAVLVEVIEHLDENRLSAFSSVVFGTAKPKIVIITTPNASYNRNYPGLSEVGESRFRHGDHRFEWNRERFHYWADKTAEKYSYSVEYEDIGDSDEYSDSPTQMGVFTLL